MSLEPKRSIEDELRQYAAGRRLEAPTTFELDGPARNRLQEEVRRVHSVGHTQVAARLSSWFWIRLVLAGAAAILIMLASVWYWPGDAPMLVSQSAPYKSDLAVRREAVGSSKLERLTDTDLASKDSWADSADQLSRELAIGAGRAQPAAPAGMPQESTQSEGTALVQSVELFLTSRVEDRQAIRGPVDAAAADTAPQPTSAASMRSITPRAAAMTEASANERATAEGRGAPMSQAFQQVQRYRLNPNSPPLPQVLQNFEWVQRGQVVEVIDADGSVYTGAVGGAVEATEDKRVGELVRATRTGAQPEVQPQPLKLQPGVQPATSGEKFTVIGMNRTLNTQVVFEGVVLPPALPGQAVTNLGASGQGAPRIAGIQIQGQATVGGAVRVAIVAVPRAE